MNNLTSVQRDVVYFIVISAGIVLLSAPIGGFLSFCKHNGVKRFLSVMFTGVITKLALIPGVEDDIATKEGRTKVYFKVSANSPHQYEWYPFSTKYIILFLPAAMLLILAYISVFITSRWELSDDCKDTNIVNSTVTCFVEFGGCPPVDCALWRELRRNESLICIAFAPDLFNPLEKFVSLLAVQVTLLQLFSCIVNRGCPSGTTTRYCTMLVCNLVFAIPVVTLAVVFWTINMPRVERNKTFIGLVIPFLHLLIIMLAESLVLFFFALILCDARKEGDPNARPMVGEPDTTDRADHPTTTGRVDHPNTTDRVDHPNTTGRVDHPNTTGRVDHPNTTGRVDHPNTTDRVDHPNTTGRVDDRNTTDRVDDPNTTDRVDHPNTTGRVDHPTTTGRVDHPNTTGRVDHPNTTDRVDHLNTTGRVDHPTTTGRVDHPNTTGRVDHPNTTGRVDHPNTTGRVDHPNTTGRADHPNTTGRVDHPNTTGRADHPNTTGRVDHPNTTGRVDHLNTTGRVDHPDTTGRVDHPNTTDRVDGHNTTDRIDGQNTTDRTLDNSHTSDNSTSTTTPAEHGNETR